MILLLFATYINGLRVCSNICLFADDCVSHREIIEDRYMRIIQTDINAIANWCDAWHTELNFPKCIIMTVHSSN